MRPRLSPRPAQRALLFAFGAAALALVAAVIAAIGPARGESAEYTWPPATLPAQSPSAGWYAPLPLLNRVPASIEVKLPCALAPALRSDGAVTVLASARRPGTPETLRILLDGNSLRIRVGKQEVATMPWPESCPLRVEISDGMVRLPRRAVMLRTETLEDMPIITGLFTGLDLRTGEPPQVVTRTRVYATSQTAQQFVAAALAAMLACMALTLLARDDGRVRRRPLRLGIQSAWHERDASDAVVVGGLFVWWIVAPTIFDDGWLWVEERAFRDLGALNFYFTSWGLTSPLGYWLEWLRQWAGGSTSNLVLMRLPTLTALLVSWPLCRWCLRRALGARPTAVVRWTLAGAFLIGATAWGMTLRPEPFISLLTVVSLAAMVSFALTPRFAPLAIAVPAAVLAATIHPAGLVATAPLFAALPEAIGWLRAGRRILLPLGALLVAGVSLALIVFTLDADLQTRVGEARLLREHHLHGEPWWREYLRYAAFDEGHGGGTATRRWSVALLLLAVAAWLTRPRSGQTRVLLLPARTLAVALVVLAFVPGSKLVWHFGTFAAVGAVVVSTEIARLLQERQPGREPIRSIAALAIVGAAALWSWTAPGNWPSANAPALDLQTASWEDAFGFTGYGWLLLPLIVFPALVIRTRRMRVAGEKVDPPAIAGWTVAVVSLAIVGVTAAVLVIDAAITPWSVARQNLEALAGGESCGLADQLGDDGEVARLLAESERPTLLSPPVAVYFPCATIPAIERGLVEVPRLGVFWWSRWPLERPDAPFAAIPDLYDVRRIAKGPRGVGVVEFTNSVPGFARVDAIRRQ